MELMQNTIQNGGFGSTGPMIQQGFNPYLNMQNNLMPFGGQPQINFMNPPMPQYPNQQYNNEGYVFSPYPMNGMDNNPYYPPMQQQQSIFGGDYYNPYPEMTNFGGYVNNQTYYNGNYGYPNYGYTSYGSPMNYRNAIDAQKAIEVLKYRIAAKFLGKELNEEKLDEYLENKFNPQARFSKMSIEERMNAAEYQQELEIYRYSLMPQPESPAEYTARIMIQMSNNFHKEFDNHSLFEFMTNDLWRLNREFWIANNIKKDNGRDLSGTYNSNDYNELLALHRSSNPYINKLMDDSRYDNNNYDVPIGMKVAFDKERRRAQFIQEKLPTYISDEETQRRRQEWTNKILGSIYGNQKGSGN